MAKIELDTTKTRTKDALEEALSHPELVNTGSGLPTPDQLIAYEQAQSEGRVVMPGEAIPLPETDEEGQSLSPQGVQPIKKDEEIKEDVPDEVAKLDALQKKIDAKEPLDEAETELLLKIKEKPAPAEEKTYNIAGTEFTFDELKDKVVGELELGDVVLSDASMKKIVEDYYKSQNRTEATRSINRGQKENAQERERLMSERAEIIATQKTLVNAIHDLSSDIAKLEKSSKDPITAEEAENGTLEDKRRYFAKKDAEEKLGDLQERRKNLETQGQRNEQAKLNNEVREFLSTQPQYQTKEPIQSVIQKLKNGETVDSEDELKVQELNDLLETASTRNASLTSVFNLRSKQGHLAVKPLLHKKSVTATLPELNKTSITDAIRKAKEKASLALPNSDGSGGGGQRGTGKKLSQAAQMIQRDKEILDNEGNDDFVRDVLGFGVKKK